MKNGNATSRRFAALFFLAVSFGLWESVAFAEVTLEAARSYYREPLERKLQLGMEYQKRGDFVMAERFYQEVLWETRDSENIAVVRALLLQLDEARGPSGFASFNESREARGPSGFASLSESHELRSQPAEVLRPMLDPPSLEAAGRPLLSWLESSLPVVLDLVAQRLARYLEAVGEERVTRVFSEKEFELHVLERMRKRFSSEIIDLATKFHSDGIIGTGTVRLGALKFRFFSKMDIVLKDERPHAVIREAKIGTIPVPAGILKLLERRVNRVIDRQNCPIRVKLFELREGSACVSVEVA